MLSECGIADQSLYTFNRVSKPQFDALSRWLPICPNSITLDFDELAFPPGSSWEAVDLF